MKVESIFLLRIADLRLRMKFLKKEVPKNNPKSTIRNPKLTYLRQNKVNLTLGEVLEFDSDLFQGIAGFANVITIAGHPVESGHFCSYFSALAFITDVNL